MREQHIQALLDHVTLQHQVRQALWRKKRKVLASLITTEAVALQVRDDAEAALRQHALIVHGETETSRHLRRTG